MKLTRITVRADQMDGVPCIRGLRIPVATVIGMIHNGMTATEVIKAYPDLETAGGQDPAAPPRRLVSATCRSPG